MEDREGEEGGKQGPNAAGREALWSMAVFVMTGHMPFLHGSPLTEQETVPGQPDILNTPYTAKECKLLRLFCTTV